MIYRLLLIFALGAGALNSQRHTEVRNIDFRNFTFPFPGDLALAVPDHMSWMSNQVNTTVTLVNGRYDFNKNESFGGSSVILNQVHYGYLTMSGKLDAMVVLGYHSGGSAYWDYVYAFSFSSESPRLLGWFQTGSRADSGLYRLNVANGEFILDLFDPDKREADCCSSGFVRTRYVWRNGKFMLIGPPKFGRLEDEPKPR